MEQLLGMGVADIEHPVWRPAGRWIWRKGIEGGIGGGRFVDAGDHPGHDVVDVGEIAAHAALVEHPDRLPRQDRLGKQHRRHVGPAPGAVHGEKAQPRSRQPIQVAVGVGHQFIGFLSGRVQAHRMVHGLMFRERQVGVTAINRTAGGIDEVLNAVMPAAFEDVAEAHQIALDVSDRVLQGIANAGLGGQMDYAPRAYRGEQLRNGGAIGDVELVKQPAARAAAGRCLEQLQPSLLQGGVVVGVEVVNADNMFAAG